MTFTPASPVAVKPDGTGFSISLRFTAKSQKVRISITKAAQEEHFGGSLEGKRLDVMIGRDGDRGRIKLVKADEGAFTAKASARGSVFVVMNRWNLLPNDKRPSQPMDIAFSDATGLTLMVPNYDRVAPAANAGEKRAIPRALPME
ncbi:hypothetical protein [Yoonia sp.]|uniref:hypothetical protein n=1 Tax=Yoonia sp. TaxID=2212373 RepID=UPI002E024C5D|nr:hypothetical protein [Yoonia sp.]